MTVESPAMRLTAILLVIASLFALACFALSRASNDLAEMLPAGDVQLAREARFFATQAATRVLVLEATAEPADLIAAGDFLTAALPRLAAVGARLPDAGTPAAVAKAAAVAYERLPELLSAEDLAAAGKHLEPAALAERLAALKARAAQPDDLLTVTAARQDILALAGGVLGRIESGPGGSRRAGAVFIHPDGRHVMLNLEVAFDPGELDRSEPLYQRCSELRAEAAAQRIDLAMIGPYRHYVENIRTVRSDLWVTLPIELALVAGLLLSLLGSVRSVLAIHVPAILAVTGSLAGAGAWIAASGGVLPLPLLGFIAGILGIAVDYATHYTVGLRRGHPPIRPLVVTFLTTASAFAVLLASSSPALRCLSIMVVTGLGCALVSTLVILPALLNERARPDRWRWLSVPLAATIEGHPRICLGLAAAMSVALLPGLAWLHFEGDLKRFDGSTRQAWKDLDAFMVRWGPPDSSSFIVAHAADRDAALAAVAQARRTLNLPPSQVERLLPDAQERAVRRAAWNAFWRDHADVADRLAAACASAGLRPAAFSQAIARYQPIADRDAGAVDWSGTPIEPALAMLVFRTGAAERGHPSGNAVWTVASPLTGVDRKTAAGLAQRLADQAPDSPAWIANRGDLGGRLIDVVRRELSAHGLFMVAAMLVLVLLLERSLIRGAAVLLPPLLAIGWSFGLLGWLGVPLSPFALLGIAFVLGIGIDSAVFLAHERGSAALSPILNASFTTIAGFGSMALAVHPVVAGMGLTLSLGMTAALFTSLLIAPALARRSAE